MKKMNQNNIMTRRERMCAKRLRKRALAAMLSLALTLSLLPLSLLFTPAAKAAPLTSVDWNGGTQGAQTLSDCEVTVTGTVTLTGMLTCSGEVVFTGSGTIQRYSSFTNGPMINLTANADVTVATVMIDGNLISTAYAAVQMNSDGAVFTLESGGIVNNSKSTARGAAVQINSTDSSAMNAHFTMNGGEISGNTGTTYGGALYIGGSASNAKCGRFTLNGGEISGNSQTSSSTFGGIVYVRGEFIMNDGEITSNNSAGRGGALYVSSYAHATIRGGIINGNHTTYTTYNGNDADIFFSSATASQDNQYLGIHGEADIGKLFVLLSNANIYPNICSKLQNPITMTFGGSRLDAGEVVAAGEGYTLTVDDMLKINNNNAPDLFLLLDTTDNQIVFTDTDPDYASLTGITPEQRLRAAAGGMPYSSDPNWNDATQTYKLTHDFTGETGTEPILTAQLDILTDFTLDLNGHTLTIETPASSTNGVKIASGKTLIIEDTSVPSIGELNVTVTSGGVSGYGAAINTTDGALVMVAGTVNATGATGGAGIGGGAARSGGTITINGGTVNATGGGGSGGAGIGGGGGGGGSGGSITINGGTVNATGGGSNGGAGIGGGGNGDGGSITITGGIITAAGISGGAGIGGGYYGGGGSITINGGSITAVAGSAAPSAIGNGANDTEGTVTITGTYNYWVNTITTPPAAQTGSGTFANNSSYRYVELISCYPVANLPGAETVTYQGTTIDLSTITYLFSIDPNAGDRTYSIESGGTGWGTILADNKTLAPAAAGTFIIGLATAATATHAAGAKVTATLTLNKGTQAAPTSPTASPTSLIDSSDGGITGVTVAMEYKLSGDASYTPVTGTTITGLEAGTYLVRYAGTSLFNAGSDKTVIIGQPSSDPDPDPDPSPGPSPSTPPSGQTSTPSAPSDSGSVVLVDGKETSAGDVTVEGNKTTVTVNQDVLNTEIENANESVAVIIPVGEGTGSAEAQFVLQNVEDMAEKEMRLTLVVGNVQYDMPATAVDTAAVLVALGADDPAQIPVSIVITTDVGAEKQAFVRQAVDGSGMELVLPPIEFTITATYNGQTFEITGFTQFVSRTVELTEEQAKQITTAVVIEPDGTTRHVPTNVYEKDGKWYATVNSLTNSTYALIYQEKTFEDAEDKWYEAIVSEMGSRGIIEGIGNGLFDGERAITRAEFVTIVVRALGLSASGERGTEGENSGFSDVLQSDWFFGAIAAASDYGLVGGVGNGVFAPDRSITREEAMVIMWKAAKLAGYEGIMGSIDGFEDAGSLSVWAVDAAMWSAGSDMITDFGGMLYPQGSISRAEAAMLVLRLLQKAELVDNRSSAGDAVPSDLLNAEPRKKPEVIQMPDGGDEEAPNPNDDSYVPDIATGDDTAGDMQEYSGTGAVQGLIGSGGGQMTPKEAIRELNALLAMCQAAWN